MSRPIRHSDAGKESHRSGLYVASPRNPAPEPQDEAEDDGAYQQQLSRKPVTLPELKFLHKKRIAGELI